MKHKIAAAVLVVAAAAPAAWAGYKQVNTVYVDTTNRSGEGALGSVRNSADTTQLVGCWISASNTGSLTGYCYARNASGVSGNCTTSSPELISQIRTISGDTYIRFYWDTAGTCTSIFVSNFSSFEPKSP
jgi:hypothetical protein